VDLAGRSLVGMAPNRVARLGVGYVAQVRNVFRTLTVEENLQIGTYIPSARADARRATESVLELFPRLAERREQAAGTLSGGEQQMLALARAIVQRPRLLLLDEPTRSLDAAAAERLWSALESRQCAVLIATHRPEDVERCGGRVELPV
jgi:branched-chain amino acid transport system ATP-binding protein